MALSDKQLGTKISAKIKRYLLTTAELLCSLCYEIPCIRRILNLARGRKMHQFLLQILAPPKASEIFSALIISMS